MEEEIENLDEEVTEIEKLRTLHNMNKISANVDNKVPHPKKTKKVLKKVERRKSKRVTGIKLILLSILLLPLFTYLYIISLHSNTLINKPLSIICLIGSILSLVMLLIGLLMTFKNKKVKTGRHVKKWAKAVASIFLVGYVGVSSWVMILLYGPDNTFRDWLVTTAMMTLNHQYFATWFYDMDTINDILANNSVVESGEDTNPDLVDISDGTTTTVYANEYEEAVLKKDEGNDLYKIIDIEYGDFKGKMAVIYDPSKVSLGVSTGIGTSLSTSYGQYITTIAKNYNAVLAINAGGFYDPDWNSSGGVPHGVVISNGKIIVNNENNRAVSVGGIIGFNSENKLVLARMTASEAIASGIRDAVDFGPFLIVNGESSYINGNGGWGKAPRTAIAQRKDGIVLFLVIDGRQTASAGADMNDLVEVLLLYGAYNAANLDGGTSSAMCLNGEIITNPRNGNFQAKTRAVPNAWIVTE